MRGFRAFLVQAMGSKSPSPKRSILQTASILALCLLLTLILGWVDYQTHTEVVLSVFYLVPIVISVWFIGERAALFVSLLAGGLAAYDTEVLSGVLEKNFWIAAWAVASRFMFFFFTVWLMGRQRRSMDSIREMARTDSLTGAYNARTIFELLQKEMERSRRFHHPLSLVYLDIDDFKAINDSLGHQTGNSVLSSIATTLKESVRRMDVVARLGGDEFSVLMPETGEAAVRTTVERVQESLSRTLGTRGWPVTISIGAVTYHRMDCTADEIIRKADNLMYQVKRGGKNGVLYAVVTE
jgi:diguanylate cyclase (GGDEF)-like protein